LSVICFFLWLFFCLSFVFLIATERKTNDRQYNSHIRKNK
jgi:hypothetical protein